jgi:hypothetical protein
VVELRDREFAQERISQLEAPCDGVTIVRCTRYGDFTYFIWRDLENKLYALAYEPRLEALIDYVLDVYWLVDSFRVRATAGSTGWPMTVAEHYAANFKDPADARYAHQTERAALDVARTDIPPMSYHRNLERQGDEGDLIQILAAFAETLPQGTADDS